MTGTFNTSVKVEDTKKKSGSNSLSIDVSGALEIGIIIAGVVVAIVIITIVVVLKT